MWLIEYSMKIVFYFWLAVGGITLTDFALALHDLTVKTYKKGPVRASQFTRMMTGTPKARKSLQKTRDSE